MTLTTAAALIAASNCVGKKIKPRRGVRFPVRTSPSVIAGLNNPPLTRYSTQAATSKLKPYPSAMKTTVWLVFPPPVADSGAKPTLMAWIR